MEEVLVFLVGAEAHHAFDAGAIIPAPVEQHDLSAGGQMEGIALEIPLAALALRGRRQRHGAADPGIETLGDAFDDAALARRIPPLEDDDQFQLLGDDPILKLDQFALQAQQFLEIEAARNRPFLRGFVVFTQQVGETVILELKLQVLVEIVLQSGADALLRYAFEAGLFFGHDNEIPLPGRHDLRNDARQCQ